MEQTKSSLFFYWLKKILKRKTLYFVKQLFIRNEILLIGLKLLLLIYLKQSLMTDCNILKIFTILDSYLDTVMLITTLTITINAMDTNNVLNHQGVKRLGIGLIVNYLNCFVFLFFVGFIIFVFLYLSTK